jgi:hypothetical protein
MHSFIYSFIYLFSHSIILSVIHSFIHSFKTSIVFRAHFGSDGSGIGVSKPIPVTRTTCLDSGGVMMPFVLFRSSILQYRKYMYLTSTVLCSGRHFFYFFPFIHKPSIYAPEHPGR